MVEIRWATTRVDVLEDGRDEGEEVARIEAIDGDPFDQHGALVDEHEGRTVVAVLHDLNHACRYAHHLVAMRDGAIVAEGPPDVVVTPELVADVFGLDAHVTDDPVTGTPMVVPLRRR
jgi:ABC-type proline/glycine betaine transport system ATPase subunit